MRPPFCAFTAFLVALHGCEVLPAPLAQAASAVAEVLPAADLSMDVADVPADGVALPEANVPAGCLDAALPPDAQQRGAVAKRPTGADGVPESLLDALDAVVGEGAAAEQAALEKIHAALTNKRLRRVHFTDGERKG